MTGIWIAFTRARDAASQQAHVDFLNGPHHDELLRLIPGVDSYVTYREQLLDGDAQFLSIGSSETLTGAELQARIQEIGPQLAPLPHVRLNEAPPRLVFADQVP